MDELRAQLTRSRAAGGVVRWALVVGVVALAACRDAPPPAVPNATQTAAPSTAPATAPNVVRHTAAGDAYSPAALLAEFRGQAPDHPVRLGAGAAPSARALTAAYVRGVERADTAALASLALTQGEFAWLYYADSPMAQAPYELDPDVMWAQISAQSDRGLARALRARGGRSLGTWRSACEPPRASGALRLHACTVTSPRLTTPLRLSLVERDGRFKLVGLGAGE